MQKPWWHSGQGQRDTSDAKWSQVVAYFVEDGISFHNFASASFERH